MRSNARRPGNGPFRSWDPGTRSATSCSSSTRRGRRRCRKGSRSSAARARPSSSRCSVCTSTRWRSRDERAQVRRCDRTAGEAVARARAAHRPAEARRRHGRRRARLRERASLPALGDGRGQARRGPVVHADDRSARRAGHGRIARRAGGEVALLVGVQGRRPLVPSSRRTDPRDPLRGRRGVLAAYYSLSSSLWEASTWWDVAFIALVLIPAVFLLVWLVLPLWRTSR